MACKGCGNKRVMPAGDAKNFPPGWPARREMFCPKCGWLLTHKLVNGEKKPVCANRRCGE